MKKSLSIFLSLLIVLGTFSVFGATAAVSVKDKTLRAYACHSFKLNKSESLKYYCKTTNNSKKYISVKFKDNGSDYTLKITAKKVTKSQRPVVTVYYKNAENKAVNVKKLRYKVTPMGTVKFRNLKINVKATEKTSLRNPFAYEYKFKATKSGIVKIPTKFSKNGTLRTYSFKALKSGKTTVKVYLKGVNKKVGSFKITAGKFKTKINPKYKTVKLKYNSHGSSTYMSESNFNISKLLMYKHAGAKYYAISDNEKIAGVVSNKIVYSASKGTTTATVYEKLKNKTTTVGTFKVKSVSAVMAYVVKQNALFYNNIIFGYGDNTEFLDLTDVNTVSLKPTIVSRLINNSLTNSHFKSSEYKITFKSTNSNVAKVSSAGKVTAVKEGSAKINFTITFKDKSSFKQSCKIIVE